jgi:cysteine desulfurase/selenocysteine lyase
MEAGSVPFSVGTPPSAPTQAQPPAAGTQGFIHPETITSHSPGLYFLNYAGALPVDPDPAKLGTPGLESGPYFLRHAGALQPEPVDPDLGRLGTPQPESGPYFLNHAGAMPQPAPVDPDLGKLDARPDLAAPPSPAPMPSDGSLASITSTGGGTNAARNPQRHQAFDVATVRADFPILQERVQGRQLVWLDNAATTQKPRVVIERLKYFYEHENSNIHRAAHTLAARSTDAYEGARQTVRRFLNASTQEEIVFVRGTTEGINLIAQTWGKRHVQSGDEIIVTEIEHHSNIVPWQMLCAQTGARLRVAPVDDSGQVLLEEYERLFNSHTRLVSFTHVSNALGTVLPVSTMTQIAHRYGACVVVDGAQSVCHTRVDVQQLDSDFYVFSGHKVFGPTGIGVVYGKRAILESMPPYQGGGNMIGDVTFEKTSYQPPPARFEAGTGNIADAVGLGAALEYLDALGLENVARHEHELLEYGTSRLREIPGLRLIGTAAEKAAVMSFVLDNLPADQVGAALASEGIAVRAGHHCAQPALRRFGLEASVRPSLAVYNNRADIDALIAALKRLQSRFLR